MSSVILVTTMWDRVGNEGAERESELSSSNIFWGGMIEKGATIHRHYGSVESALSILRIFVLRVSTSTVLNIQSELVIQKKSLGNTAAGQILNRELNTFKQKYEEYLEKLKATLSRVVERPDLEMAAVLEGRQKEYDSRLRANAQELESLKAHLLLDSQTFQQNLEPLTPNREKAFVTFNQELNQKNERH